MATYKEALKQMLEDDKKSRKKRKSKSSHSVQFKELPSGRTKSCLKRKDVTPYRMQAVKNAKLSIANNSIAFHESDSEINGTPSNFFDSNPIKTTLDFDTSSSSSETYHKTLGSDWVKEADYFVSPSASEFSRPPESVPADISICGSSDAQSPDVSHLFDYTSSDSSSSAVHYSDLFPDDLSCSLITDIDQNDAADVVQDETLNSEDEDDLYDDIICETPNGCVIILKKDRPLYFHGTFLLSVLYGSVDVLGSTLTPGEGGEVEIYSLRGSSYLFLENRHERETKCERSHVETILSESNVNDDVARRVIDNWTASVAIVFCKRLVSQNLTFFEKHVAQQLLPKPDGRRLLCTFRENPSDWNVLRINDRWEDLAARIDATSRVMLCGGKGVGKSTLLRFLVNRLLAAHPRILVIDLDPGQPEFTVSGCISVTVVTTPVFGPNYTHLHVPSKCVFVRNVNIAFDPSDYISCVVELLKDCDGGAPNTMPTLINYMGYSRGLGLNLAAAIVSIVSPNLLVQIQSGKRQRNFTEMLSVEVVKAHSKLLNQTNFGDSLSYDLVELESMTDGYEGWLMEPRIVRELGVLSYFSRILGPNNLCITSCKVPMYKVKLSDISIISGDNVNTLATVNANLVAVCSTSKSANVFNCHGWGIVRGIDTINDELFLLTPVSDNELENVTHLLLGAVSLPPAVYMAQGDKHGVVPYVSLGLITDFNTIPKRSLLHKSIYTNHVFSS